LRTKVYREVSGKLRLLNFQVLVSFTFLPLE
jgi:hypothetical protein